ncbi:MAG TPA: MarR family winged helix-turn-helix transcriptional regulator [Thermoanaerobaculia bacterium]|nr:MarR family winged helix-turn-helix transcriptional regulator [Thermoanaerobaculia bacterium]
MTDSQRILDSIRRLVRMLRLSDRGMQNELGLSGAQLFVLHELVKTSGISLSDLAERTRTDQSSVSVVVSRLVDAGHVIRDRDRADARKLVLSLTKSGRALAEKAPPSAQEKILEILEHLSSADRRRFADTFSEVIDRLGEGRGAAPMLFENGPESGRGSKQ